MAQMSLRGRFFTAIPDGTLKKKFFCFYVRHFKGVDFDLFYRKGVYEVRTLGISFLFKEHSENVRNPISALVNEFPGYLEDYQPKEGDVVFDFGAYDGRFSIMMGKLVGPQGKVFAFEPDPSNIEKFQDNIALNGSSNVTIIPKAIWGSEGTMKLYQAGQGSTLEALTEDTAHVEVPITTLDKAVEELGLTKVNIVKMDVEGAEIGALQGGECFLSEKCENLAIATYHLVDGERTAERVESMLASKGFETRTGHDSHLTTFGRKLQR